MGDFALKWAKKRFCKSIKNGFAVAIYMLPAGTGWSGKSRFGRLFRLMLGSLRGGKMPFICGLTSA